MSQLVLLPDIKVVVVQVGQIVEIGQTLAEVGIRAKPASDIFALHTTTRVGSSRV